MQHRLLVHGRLVQHRDRFQAHWLWERRVKLLAMESALAVAGAAERGDNQRRAPPLGERRVVLKRERERDWSCMLFCKIR